MLSFSLALAFALGGTPITPSSSRPTMGPAAGAEAYPVIGPPKLLSSEILDGGFNNIDEGVLVSFGAGGRRYEVWEVQKNVAMNHALVLAFDAAGQELWRTKFTWDATDTWWKPLGSTVDAAGDLYFMYLTMSTPHRWRLVKVDAAGAVAWSKTLYSTSWGEEATFLAPHPQGGIVVQSAADGQVRDLYTARVSSAGDVLWSQKFDVGGSNQFPGGLAVAADGSVYAVGHDRSARVRKYTADGAIAWTQSYEAGTPYEYRSTRHAFLDREGNLVVAGSTYAGGNDEDWTFVLKYSPAGARLRAFVAKVGSNSVKLSDYGLQGVYATHGPDDSVYFAWDHTDQLDTQWTLARVVVPGADASPRGALVLQKVELEAVPRVVWTRSFEGEDAMSVEELVWFPGGAVGALGRGKRKLQGYDYRSDTRLRAVTAAGVDLGGARFGSPGDFHNEPTAVAVSPGGVAHVLGWQYWNGDGWNDENVMRLRFALRP